MRLKDADALKYEPIPKDERNYRTYNLDDAYEDGYHDAFVDVMNAPTVDAIPISLVGKNTDTVRHGKWIKADSQQYFRKHYPCFTCSECGYRKDSQKTWNYCPNCGARMDKE